MFNLGPRGSAPPERRTEDDPEVFEDRLQHEGPGLGPKMDTNPLRFLSSAALSRTELSNVERGHADWLTSPGAHREKALEW